jgi:hypothetical protein
LVDVSEGHNPEPRVSLAEGDELGAVQNPDPVEPGASHRDGVLVEEQGQGEPLLPHDVLERGQTVRANTPVFVPGHGAIQESEIPAADATPGHGIDRGGAEHVFHVGARVMVSGKTVVGQTRAIEPVAQRSISCDRLVMDQIAREDEEIGRSAVCECLLEHGLEAAPGGDTEELSGGMRKEVEVAELDDP